jgi:hypothetical protein
MNDAMIYAEGYFEILNADEETNQRKFREKEIKEL